MFGIFDKIEQFFRDALIGAIEANLQGRFDVINESVAFVSTQAGTTPQGFNAEVYSLIKNINDSVIIPVAGLIITAVLCIELIQVVLNKNNMHDTDTFEIFKYVFKMAVAVYLVSNAFTFTMAAFDVGQHMVSKAAGVISGAATISGDNIQALVESFKEESIGKLVVILLELSIVKLVMKGIRILVTVLVYGRIFEIYVYSSVSAIPFATMGNKEWGQIGTNYVKGLFALALQGLFWMITLGVYGVLVRTVDLASDSAILLIVGYSILLGLMMMKSGTLAKSILNAH